MIACIAVYEWLDSHKNESVLAFWFGWALSSRRCMWLLVACRIAFYLIFDCSKGKSLRSLSYWRLESNFIKK